MLKHANGCALCLMLGVHTDSGLGQAGAPEQDTAGCAQWHALAACAREHVPVHLYSMGQSLHALCSRFHSRPWLSQSGMCSGMWLQGYGAQAEGASFSPPDPGLEVQERRLVQLRDVEQRARSQLSFAILGPAVLSPRLPLLLLAALPYLALVPLTHLHGWESGGIPTRVQQMCLPLLQSLGGELYSGGTW